MKPSRSLDPNLLEVEVVKKMNFRNIALVAALVSIAGVANAQSFELRQVGGAAVAANTFVVSPGVGTFQAEIWLINNQARDGVTNVTAAVAYDSTAGAAATSATPLSNKLSFNAYTASLTGTGLVGPSTRGLITGTANSTIPASDLAATAVRSYGRLLSHSTGTGAALALGVGAFKVGTLTLNYNLANGETWGDAGEVGLVLMANTGENFTSNTSGINGINAGQSDPAGNVAQIGAAARQFGSAKYKVAAVPEPATMTALGLGLAAIARRRRSAKK